MSDHERARALRTAFDQAFAEAPRPPEARRLDVLCIRLGHEPHVIVLSEITAIHADLQVVAVPSPAPALRGLAAVRGAIVPIYDLAIALGLGAIGASRWTVLARDVGFAIPDLAGHARTTEQAIAAMPAGGQRTIRGVITLDEVPHSVIDLGGVLAKLHESARSAREKG